MYSLESPHRGDSNEYTQPTNISQKIEKTSLNDPQLPPDLALYAEQMSMVLKMLELLQFDCSSHGYTRVTFVLPESRRKIKLLYLVNYTNTEC